jgi:hypothetical protein
MSKQHFNDEYDFTNDDGYPTDGYSTLDDCVDIPQEWLDEEEDYWSGQELDPADPDNYDDPQPADEWQDEGEDEDTGLDYDRYNDAENY